jgi:hypothetical protein
MIPPGKDIESYLCNKLFREINVGGNCCFDQIKNITKWLLH